MVDNYDSFTYNLVHLLEELGAEVVTVRNDAITLDEAVHAHTVVAHESVGRTDVGRLVPGQLADLIAVDRDLWALEEPDPMAIRDTQVLQTWVGGELAFEQD